MKKMIWNQQVVAYLSCHGFEKKKKKCIQNGLMKLFLFSLFGPLKLTQSSIE
jgi:hypothetical protein